MHHKKSENDQQTAEQQALEQRVDAMMNVERTAAAAPAPEPKPEPEPEPPKPEPDPAPQPATPPAQPAADPEPKPLATAPTLPSKLLKDLDLPESASHDPAPAKSEEPLAPPDLEEPAAKPPATPEEEVSDPPSEEADKADEADEADDSDKADKADEADAAAVADPALPSGDPLADHETDAAVDDIVAQEGDTQLAVDDAIAGQRAAAVGEEGGPGLLALFFTSWWTWSIIIMALIVVYLWFR